MLKPRPSIWTGLPRLPASPFQGAVSNTPADRTGACVDCFPARAAFPEQKTGRRLHRLLSRPARTSLALQPAGSLDRPRRPLSRGFGPASYPAEPQKPGEQTLCAVDRIDNKRAIARYQWQTLGPAGGDIDHRQRLDERSRHRRATMCDHVDLTEAWRRAVPIVERADRNLAPDGRAE